MKIVLLLLGFAMLLLVPSGYGSERLNFKYLSSRNGLSNNHVTAVMEDSKGFLWFGTSDGLNKWNGYDVEIFRYNLDDVNSISSNFILTLDEDLSGNIWIGTNQSGVVRYDYSKQEFNRYTSNFDEENSVPSIFIRKIMVDATNTVWVATDRGLCSFVPEKDNFKRVRFGPEGEAEAIYNIYKLADNNLIFHTNQGIFHYSTVNKIFKKLEFPVLANYPELYTNNCPIRFSSGNILWIGVDAGLIKYNLTTNTYKIYQHNANDPKSVSSNALSCVFEDSEHRIWVGTEDGGVNLYNRITDDFRVIKSGMYNERSISNNIVTTIFEDSYQNIWFGTQEGGLSYFNGKNAIFQHHEHYPIDNLSLSHNKVSSFVEDKNGQVWVGTGNGGLNKFNVRSETFDRYQLKSETVAPSILGLVSIDDQLYVTGWGCGLNRFDLNTKRFSEVISKAGSSPDRSPLNVKGLGSDTDGNVWIATHYPEGIYVYSTRQNQFFNAQHPGPFNVDILKVPYAVTIKQDSKGRIWVVSYSGLFMYDGTFHRFRNTPTDPTTISSNYVYTICESADKSIWIGNANGLDKLNETSSEFSFERYSSKYQLPNNVKGIVEDDNGNVWLSSNQGLTMFNPKTKISQQFQINNGLPVQEFFERSCMKDRNGKLYFGSTNGFFSFHPDSLSSNKKSARIYITDFRIFNETPEIGGSNSPLKRSILFTDTLLLTYDQSVFSFEFVALNINSAGRTEYAYMLEGFEDKWNFVENQRFVNYTNIAPGKYVFRVRTATGKQLNEGDEAKIYIVISPPFWKTKWAYIAYLITILFSLYLFQRSILYREKLKSELRLEKVEMKNVVETNLMKLRFFTNISHEFRTPITLIKAPIEKLMNSDQELSLQERQYHYQLIFNSTQKLLNMVNQLMDYRKLEAGSLVLEPSMGDVVGFCRKTWDNFAYLAAQKQITYQFHTELNSLIIAFDVDKLDKVLSNLLSNAFKCTDQGGMIDLSIRRISVENELVKGDFVEISVKDNGIGIPEADLEHIFDRFYMVSNRKERAIQGSGIGLTLAKEMIELHKGTISVVSKEKEGSEFVVQLPLNIEMRNALTQPKEVQRENHDAEIDELEIDQVPISIIDDRPTLLIVEDDEELLSFITHELSFIYNVIVAKNGQEGFQMAINHSPNLVLSDVMMPIMNGIELCKKIKSDERTSHMPVILLTARYSQEKELEGFESGADAYVLKPFNLQILLVQISNLLTIRKELIDKFTNGTSLYFDTVGVETKDQRLMQEIIDLIIENITNDKINASFIADKLHISRSLLYLKIEALTGQSVNEFIRNIRLKKALQLMNQSSQTFTEVAYAVGFTSQSYFSRSFTKQFGCSPKDFMKNQKLE